MRLYSAVNVEKGTHKLVSLLPILKRDLGSVGEEGLLFRMRCLFFHGSGLKLSVWIANIICYNIY